MKGGIRVICNGYVMIYMPEHHMAFANGHVYEHVVQAEKMLGRELKHGEVVHHKDKNRSNNSCENLMVFKTNSDHVSYHQNNENLKKIGDVWICPNRQYKCQICGKEKSNTGKICASCYREKQRANFPEKSILEKLVVEDKKSFLKIGKKFGVSDNTVRKWCKYYEIPFKRQKS